MPNPLLRRTVAPLLAVFILTAAGVAPAAPSRPHPQQIVSTNNSAGGGSGTALRAGGRLLTLEDIYGPGRSLNPWGNLPDIISWQPDGAHYIEYAYNATGQPQLMQVDARTGTSTPLYDANRMEAALTAQPGIDMPAAHGLVYRDNYTFDASQTRLIVPYRNALYLYDGNTGRAAQLTAEDAKTSPSNESFSPDGKHVAFVRGGDLYVVDVATPGKERRLTRDGGPKIRNGRLDWVYEEELYGRGKTDGYAWSPDSSKIAFLHLDEQDVKPFPIVDDLSGNPDVEREWYPKAGDPNPVAGLGIAAVDGKTPVRFVDVTKYPDDDRLLVRFCWTPDSARLFFQVQNRVQTFLDLNSADAATGETKTLFRESTNAWVDVIDNPYFLSDGTFLWQSDRSGHRHLLRYRPDGTSSRNVTTGDWDIKDFYGIDPTGKYAYFSATEHSAIANHAYRVSLTGSAAPPERLTTVQDGNHRARFDPTFHFFLDEWSDINTLPHLRLADANGGATLRELADSAESAQQVAPYLSSRPEFLQVKARDGFVMEAMLLRPPDFDPAKKYPVFCPVYGGPGAPTVRNEWQGRDWLFYQLLAQKGYIVWLCDNRSASGKGAASMWPIYHRVGEIELRDMEDSLDYLKKQPWVDPARIGISGWSFGGFLAEYALTHSKSFKVGISGAGVSDWRLYDTIYTERYMGTPTQNTAGYISTAPVTAAGNCAGRLLLLHGMMDDNVHVQNTVQMAYALQKSGKVFDLMLYPGRKARHGIDDAQQDRHLNTLIARFILENL